MYFSGENNLEMEQNDLKDDDKDGGQKRGNDNMAKLDWNIGDVGVKGNKEQRQHDKRHDHFQNDLHKRCKDLETWQVAEHCIDENAQARE